MHTDYQELRELCHPRLKDSYHGENIDDHHVVLKKATRI